MSDFKAERMISILNIGIRSFVKKNRQEAFKHFVEVIKKQNIETITVNENEYSYTTKRGLVKRFLGFNSFAEYKKSELYPKKAEQVNGFYFVAIE